MYIHIVINKDKEVFGCWSSETDALKQSQKLIDSKIIKMKLNSERCSNNIIDPSLFDNWKIIYKRD